eukprot:COSAG05_NODE_16866_length_337_cov_0.500000_1_plen_70_part_10
MRELQASAVERHAFGLAEQYEHLLKCLSPRSTPWATTDCAPIGLEEQADFFFNLGFVVVERVLHGEDLAS